MIVLPMIAFAAGYFAWGAWDSMPAWPESGFAAWFQEQFWSLVRVGILLGVLGLVAAILLAYLWVTVLQSGRNTVAGSIVETFERAFGKFVDFVASIFAPLLNLLRGIL